MSTNINFNKKLGITGGAGITLPTSSTPSFSNVNSFSFDGVDDYFLGTSTYSELNGANKATFSFWIKPQDNGLRILLHVPINYTNAHGQFLIYQRNGRIQMNIDSSSYYCLTPDNTLILNEWQHVMICMDLPSLDEGKIFINGVDKTNLENWYNRTALSPSIGGLYIGEANNGYLSPFYGNLDEVAIWSGTDLRNDVATIYNNGTPTDLNNNGLTAPTTWQRMGENATWNGLTWTMTDVNGSYTNRAANMVEANRTTDVPTPPPFSNTKSIQLDGVDDYVDCGNDSSLNLTSQITWSAWVKFNALNNAVNYGIVSNFDPNEGYKYTFIYYPSTTSSSRKLRLRINSSSGSLSGYYDTSVDLSDNQWHHVAFSFDGTTNANGIKVYVDGVNVNSFTSSNAGIFSSSGSTLIGAYQTASWFANANIDEVSVFNSALSQSDVTAIYGGGNPSSLSSYSSLVSWWRCGDGDTAPTLTDNGSGGNNGTMTNFSTFSTDVPTASSFTNTKSILLDGVDDYVDCGDNDNLSFGNGTTDSPFSISAWVNMTDATRFRIVFKADNTTGNNEYGFFCDASDRINFILYDSKSNVSRGRYYNVGLISYQGQWINLVATYDGQGGTSAQNGIKIYLNGTQVDNVDVSTGTYTAMQNGGAPLEIGKFLTNFSSGLIDETAIFNSELSQSDVTSIYNGGVPNDISSLSPLSWWRFENTGTTATDSGSGGNDGTLINGVTRSTDVPIPSSFTNTKSILLDGVDDFVSFSQVTYTGEFTTSFWIKPINLGTSFLVGRDTSSDYVWLRTVSQIRVRVNFSTYSFIESGGNDINANAWNHLLVVRDASNNLTIFLNGAIFASSQVAAGQHRLDQIGKVGTSYYDGNVDETAFWDSDQSSNLATIYNSGVPNDISSLSPTLWYRMGDGDTSPTLTDNGSGGNDGTITNFTTFSTDVPT